MPTTVLVLMGGPDREREVSLVSGRAVAQALRETGRFAVRESVIARPNERELRSMVADARAEVVFPALHGAWGEGGPLQEILEQIRVPYVGSGPRAAALAMDKLATKRIVAEAGVRTPPACGLDAGAPCPLPPPLVLKPIADGSSVDLRICRSADEVAAARVELHPRRGRLLAEAYVPGRELTVGILGDDPLPMIEILPTAPFYDYAAKYERDDTRYVLDPDLPDDVAEEAVAGTLTAFRQLGCRDLARADFMLGADGLFFLEINTMPGFTSHSLVPMAGRHLGLDLPAMCALLVDRALRRGGPARSALPAMTAD